MPPEFCQVSKLQYLVLSGNRLRSLPREIGKLTKLRSLDAMNNQLTTLPREFCQIATLHSLELDGNPWAEPPATVIPKAPHIPNIEIIQARLREV